MKFRRGDVVSVPGVIQYDESRDDGEYLFVTIEGTHRMVLRGNVTMVQPHLEPGEKVLISEVEWEVIAVHNQMVWAKYADISQVFQIGDVARIDLPEPVAYEQPPAAPHDPAPALPGGDLDF